MNAARSILISAIALAAGCGAPDVERPRLELAHVDLTAVATMPHPASGTDEIWTERRVPPEIGDGAVLANAPDGALLAVQSTTFARSTDDGETWTVTPEPKRDTRYTNNGGTAWVDARTVAEPWYPHGRLEAARPVVAVGATPTELVVFARGAYSASVASLPASAAMGRGAEDVFLTTGGAIADGLSYAGPLMASFDVPKRPVLVGTARYQTVIWVATGDDTRWRVAWRGSEYGPSPVAVRMVTEGLGYLLVADGTLYETSDGLRTWQLAGFLPPGTARRARALTPVGTEGLVVVGTGGLALYSNDRGRTWQKSSCPEGVDLEAVAASGAKVWATGRAGALVASYDHGATFMRVNLPVGKRIGPVVVRDDRAWILAGDRLFISP